MSTSASPHHPVGASSTAPPTYVSGERVFGPPIGTFDVDWVAREIDRQTLVSFETAHRAVAEAWADARSHGSLDPALLAAAAERSGAPAEVAGVVAEHVVAYCAAYGVDPAAR